MKKKSLLSKLIKRSLLTIISLTIVIFLAVYFLDVYKTSGTEFINEYDDSYWEDLEGNGFVYCDDIINEIETNNVSSGAYKLPYDEGEVFDLIERLEYARYYKEVKEIYDRCKYAMKSELVNGQLVEVFDYNKTNGFYNMLTESQKAAFEAKYTELREKFSGYTFNNFKKDYYNNREILNNGKFRLMFNMEDTTFVLEQLDIDGNVISSWNSIPESPDKNLVAQQSSIISLEYVSGNPTNSSAAAVTLNTYNYSTNKIKNYYVNIIDENEDGEAEKVQVYYVLTDTKLDYTYFPRVLTGAQIDELAARTDEYIAEYKSMYGTNPKDSNKNTIESWAYPPYNKPDMSQDTIIFLSQIFGTYYELDQDNDDPALRTYRIKSYNENLKCDELQLFFTEWCNFEPSELKETFGDGELFFEKPKVEIAIEYSLTDNGLEVMLPGNSVRTNNAKDGYAYRVTTIDVLPYFTAVKNNERSKNTIEYGGELVKGYTIIPDGSGAILEFNRDKISYSNYLKEIYTSDLAFTKPILSTSTNDILLPMYAMVYTGPDEVDKKAILVEFTDGAAQASIFADVARVTASQTNSFNRASFKIFYREIQNGKIGTVSWGKEEFNMYTTKAADGDYRINYNIVDMEKYEASYSGVAKCYRDIIVERSEGLLNVNGDTTTDAILDLEVIGSYSYDTNFLGIGYTGKDSMTTAEELGKIIEEIQNIGINNINVYYYGWRNTGLVNTSFKNIKVSNQIGGKKELLKLISEVKESVNIYPQVEFLEFEKYQESFGRGHYTTRDVTGAYSEYYPYELNTNMYNNKANKIMALSPAYYNAFATKLAENYHRVLGIDTIALSGLGSKLTGYYRQDKEMFKSAAVVEQQKAFEILLSEEYGIKKIALETPYAYALQYASNAYNVPYEATNYDFLDYSIPFYQLVINGLFDYSGASINKNAEQGIAIQLMRCIETGSNLSFTFTYEDSSKLLQTDYNNYYYTLYSRWLSDVKAAYEEVNGLNIYKLRLTDHQYLDNDVYKVTYSNADGSEKVEIIINYLDTHWNYNGSINVPAKSYKVIE